MTALFFIMLLFVFPIWFAPNLDSDFNRILFVDIMTFFQILVFIGAKEHRAGVSERVFGVRAVDEYDKPTEPDKMDNFFDGLDRFSSVFLCIAGIIAIVTIPGSLDTPIKFFCGFGIFTILTELMYIHKSKKLLKNQGEAIKLGISAMLYSSIRLTAMFSLLVVFFIAFSFILVIHFAIVFLILKILYGL